MKRRKIITPNKHEKSITLKLFQNYKVEMKTEKGMINSKQIITGKIRHKIVT
jgi:hypothetical protein